MQKNLKIGVLIPEFPGQTHAFFWREITAMEAVGATVQIFSTRRPAPDACPHRFGAQATARTRYLFPPSGAALTTLARRPRRLMRGVGYLLGLRESALSQRLKLMALLFSAADLAQAARQAGLSHLHIHSCANAAHLGALAHILDDLPYSLTLHGDLPVYGTDHASKMARARFVSAVTRPLAEQVRSVAPDTPAPVIWMGVDTDVFHPAPQAGRAEAPFTFVTVARLNHMKGHRFFLRALAGLRDDLPDIRYVIVGDGPARADIAAEIETLHLQDRVEMRGALDEEAVRAQLQSADALALTSIGAGEAAPVTVMEGMSCGLPVICSVIGGTPDMITDGTDGLLVAQEDVEAIAGAIRRLVGNPQERRIMSEQARATALAKFSHHANAQKLLAHIAPAA